MATCSSTEGNRVIGQNWTTPRFALPPVAPRTGPFPRRGFLESWWTTRSEPEDELMLVEAADALLPLRKRNGTITFCGDADLTDYHTPLGSGSTDAFVEAARDWSGHTVDLDSLPAEASVAMSSALTRAGVDVRSERHATAAVLRLPASFDDWLETIGKKQRHEVRRKRRRFAEELGEPTIERHHDQRALKTFFAMHRRASGAKGDFMTPRMEAFFAGLHATAGATVDVLLGDGRPVATAFGFECDCGYYLYNSAYDPAAGYASPGTVMLALLIEDQIRRGAEVFDFLKGDEQYKFRLGAEERPLFRLQGRLP